MSRHSNALLGLVGTDTPVGYNVFGGTCFPDFAKGIMVNRETGPLTGAAGLKKFTIGDVGTEDIQATEVDIFGADGGGNPLHTFLNESGCLHPNGTLYLPCASSFYALIDVETLTLNAVLDASGLGTEPHSDDGPPLCIFQSFQEIPVRSATYDYVVSQGLSKAAQLNEVSVWQVTASTINIIYAVNIAEEVAALGPGHTGTSVANPTFFVTGKKFNYGGGDPTPAVLYEYTINGVVTATKRTIRSVAPADIDATWTNFTGVTSPGFDQADGNIVLFFATQDAVTTTGYLVKFDANTGDILWRSAATRTEGGVMVVQLEKCNINRQLTVYGNDGDFIFTTYDLRDGSKTTQEFNHGLDLGAAEGQLYDWITGGVIGLGAGGYSQSGSGSIPTYLGGYLADHGNAIPEFRWMEAWGGPVFFAAGQAQADVI